MIACFSKVLCSYGLGVQCCCECLVKRGFVLVSGCLLLCCRACLFTQGVDAGLGLCFNGVVFPCSSKESCQFWVGLLRLMCCWCVVSRSKVLCYVWVVLFNVVVFVCLSTVLC